MVHGGHFQLQRCSEETAGRREGGREKHIDVSVRYAEGNHDCQIKGSFRGVSAWSSELFKYEKASVNNTLVSS